MRFTTFLGMAMVFALTGCADFACLGACHRHTQNSTSLVEFLYPAGATPPPEDAQPQLHLPLRVGDLARHLRFGAWANARRRSF
ncbi:MAG TPA: hypothetical protein VN325_20970 [Steroidobacteraceae bacterium]|nr:hypothetical protein [Steroidobacteraceae bacterium]